MFGEEAYFVRLACVRHAASVRPEPGSNSRLIFCAQAFAQLLRFFSAFLCLFKFTFFFRTSSQLPSQFLEIRYELKGFLCCFIVQVQFPFLLFFQDSLNSLSCLFDIVNCQFFLFSPVPFFGQESKSNTECFLCQLPFSVRLLRPCLL